MSSLAIHALHAGYGASTVLRGVDLTVAEGESVALVGRNGAGKSTLLMSLFGETRIFSGEIRVGADARRQPPRLRRRQARGRRLAAGSAHPAESHGREKT